MDVLVFRLYGPMASWGEIAVGESRHTANYPGKSAIIGCWVPRWALRATTNKNSSNCNKATRWRWNY
jgi:CRISPR system Cascade subunit CasD